MTHTQLNEYIHHYLEKDKTQSAIMLTGAWGSGKSYYIKKSLIPYLNTKDNECVSVSMYGIKELSEISKHILCELFLLKMNKKEQLAAKPTTGVKLVGKTILKGVASWKGIDISVDEKDLSSVFESLNMKGKLIIFEDLERSHIDISEIMGYVNNLVEQDSVKVLLVTNEEEFLKFAEEDIISIKESKYWVAKEKTVSDTIKFNADFESALTEIVDSFNNVDLSTTFKTFSIEDINYLFIFAKSKNLRSFAFACQKTTDLYETFTSVFSPEMLQCIFISNIMFSFKLKNGNAPKWDNEIFVSEELGHPNFPLLKISYDYIVHQIPLENETVVNCIKSYDQYRLYNERKSDNDKDLSVLYEFITETEINVKQAIENISKRLEDKSNISFLQYGSIASYVVYAGNCIGIDISACKKSLIANLTGCKDKVKEQYLFTRTIQQNNQSTIAEFHELKENMLSSLNKAQHRVDILEYTANGLNHFCKQLSEYTMSRAQINQLFNGIDIVKFGKTLEVCTSKTIESLRTVLIRIYGQSNASEYSTDNKYYLNELLEIVETIIKQNTCVQPKMDKIQMLQMNFLAQNIKGFINN